MKTKLVCKTKECHLTNKKTHEIKIGILTFFFKQKNNVIFIKLSLYMVQTL